MSSSPVPLKTRRVGQRCTLNLSRAETSSRWCKACLQYEQCLTIQHKNCNDKRLSQESFKFVAALVIEQPIPIDEGWLDTFKKNPIWRLILDPIPRFGD
ncbi:hypothetical protein TNCV_2609251 [Trichonephila clavipes]|nr:hypothetical protein TNCV_2609251 [Trichonephila clavipes]